MTNVIVLYTCRLRFQDFVRFTISEVQTGQHVDINCGPQYAICQPCRVSYDFVGHHETLYEDADYVLSRIDRASQTVDAEANRTLLSSSERIDVATDPPARLRFPRSNQGISRKGSAEMVDEMMATLQPADIDALYKRYEFDFRLFGYRWNG